MEFSAEAKASILVDALPYIQEFYGKTIVIKYGGNAMINDDLNEDISFATNKVPLKLHKIEKEY